MLTVVLFIFYTCGLVQKDLVLNKTTIGVELWQVFLYVLIGVFYTSRWAFEIVLLSTSVLFVIKVSVARSIERIARIGCSESCRSSGLLQCPKGKTQRDEFKKKLQWHITMYDFHDFGLIWKCQKIFLCGCTITSKTKINVVWNFFYTPGGGTLRSKKFQTTLILAFEANSAFVPRKWDQNRENQT